MLSRGAGWQPDSRQMVEGQSGGDGQAPVNQSAGRPKGIRRVSGGVTGRYGGSAGPGQGCSEVRPVEGRSCSAALKSEDRRPKPERGPKSEGRRISTSNIQHPIPERQPPPPLDVRCSMFPSSPFFGLRISGLEWPGPTLERPWVRGRMAANGSRRPGKGRPLHLSSVSAFSTSGFRTA